MIAVLLCTLLHLPALAGDLSGQVTEASPHYDLEKLYGEGKDDEGLKLARERIASNPDDADLYWLAVRFMYEQGERMGERPSSERMAHYTEMGVLANKGLDLRPGDPHIRFARGLANARLGTTKGVLASLFMARSIEADWLAAANSGFRYSALEQREVLPTDAYQALGVFYRLVPDWWIVQVIAGTRGDLDKSLDYLEKAAAGRENIPILKELGVTRACIGVQRDQPELIELANQAYDQALAMPPQNEKHRIDHKHIALLKADPTMACEYSRDGQQDLDKKKLKGD
jgi:tetratricopeptide (TPR) repeat protein